MKTCAVVVTYNRINLLRECVNSILCQSYKTDKIIIIDNQSTDGTDKLFKSGGEFALDCIEYRRMNANLGGAGGFYEGVKIAYKAGYDWIWIMDDDTIPTKTALAEFMDSTTRIDGKISFLASAVYGSNNEPMNVPDLDRRRTENGYQDWYYYSDEGIIKIESATFVSVIINREAVSAVGFPYKDLFIWGDDKEYTLRLSHNYAPAYLIGKSKVIHKRAIAKRISIENESDPKRIKQFYYNYRNILVNVNEYEHGFRSVLRRLIEFNALSLKILFSKEQSHKFSKIFTIHRGIFGYFIGTHNRKKFKKRFKVSD